MANQATVHRAKFHNPGTPEALPTLTGLSSYTLNFCTDNFRIGFGGIAFSDRPETTCCTYPRIGRRHPGQSDRAVYRV